MPIGPRTWTFRSVCLSILKLLCPCPQKSKDAKEYLATCILKFCSDVFVEMFEMQRVRKSYNFITAPGAYLVSIEENFIEELNESLLKGIISNS